MELVSKNDAKSRGLTRFFDGRPCPKGHVAQRLVSSHQCVECSYISRNKWRAKRRKPPLTVEERQIRRQARLAWRRQYDRRRLLGDKRRQWKRAYNSNKWRTELQYRMTVIIRGRLNIALRRRKSKRSGSAIRDLGCSVLDFRQYIESQFYGDMSWDNWGAEWQLDHRMPLSSFDLSDREQFLAACHFSNYQPLSIADHKRKTADEKSVQ